MPNLIPQKLMIRHICKIKKIRRQADYVKFLWQAKNGHYNQSHATAIWNDTYEKLKGEFDEFKNRETTIENQIKEDKKTFKCELGYELLQKIKEDENEKALSEQSAFELYNVLEHLVWKKRFSKGVLSELGKKVKYTAANTESFGTGSDVKKPVIKMIAS
jgi:hypothetical protein